MAMELKQQLAEELSGLGFLPSSVNMHKMRKVTSPPSICTSFCVRVSVYRLLTQCVHMLLLQ